MGSHAIHMTSSFRKNPHRRSGEAGLICNLNGYEIMTEKNENPLKVIVLGFDGADFRLIQPWVEAGHLPGFAKIMAEGAWGELESVPNQRSAAAWTSFMTGKNPGQHGIFEFYDYQADSYNIRFLQGQMRQGRTLWNLAGEAGRNVGVINVPMTYPAEAVNGFLIAGLDAPGVESKGFTYPDGIYKEVLESVGGYTIEPGLIGCIVGGDVDGAEAKLYEEIDQKIATSRYLMKKYPCDLLVTVFSETNRLAFASRLIAPGPLCSGLFW